MSQSPAKSSTQNLHAAGDVARDAARFEALLIGGAMLLWTTGPDGEGGEHSGWLQFTGQTPQDLASSGGWLEAVHPDDREGVLQAWGAAKAGGEPFSFTFRVRHSDGSYRALSSRGVPVRDSSGKVIEWIGTSIDITRLREIEQQLRESEERFRLLAENIRAVMYVSDPHEPRVLYVSPAYAEIWGRSPESLYENARSFVEAVHPEDRPRILESLQRQQAGERTVEEYRVIRPGDGGMAWVRDMAFPILDEQGRVYRIVGIVQDVSDRRQVERRLSLLAEAGVTLASSLDYERTLHNLAELVVPDLADWCAIDVVDHTGELKRVAVVHPDPAKVELAYELNRRYPPDPEAQMGVPHVLRTGEPEMVPVITDEMIRQSARDQEHERVLSELQLRSYICVPLTARGRVLGALSLIQAESGRAYGAEDLALAQELARRAAVAVDNALLFEAERTARADAERAGRLKDEFLATLSHELRTPLNAILGWSQLLRRQKPGSADFEEGLSIIERNAQAQTQLIEDLLDMSRIISGKLRLVVQLLRPGEVVKDAIEAVRPAAEAREIRLETVLDPHAGPIRGDAARLQQVVWNVLSNAIKFTPRGGKVQVGLSRVNSHIEISVSDTGRGIEPEFLPYVFDRFRQADASTTRTHGGLGLGLSIVKSLVELHGGTVRVSSPGLDMGSTFTVALPLVILHEAETPPDTGERVHDLPPEEADLLAGLSVLMVDDEPDARTLVKRVLEEAGATVRTAASAAEGMDALRAGRFDVIISDIGMPHQDGYDFIRMVRALPAEAGGRTPAAALTAFARSIDRRRALLSGYQSHSAKPIEPAELVSVVASLAGRMGRVDAE